MSDAKTVKSDVKARQVIMSNEDWERIKMLARLSNETVSQYVVRKCLDDVEVEA